MKRQRGQAAVEFALIFPMLALFVFAMIYGGAMFVQFLNLSNDQRSEARKIAMMDSAARHTELGVTATADYPSTEATAYNVPSKSTWGSFYTVTQKVWVEHDDTTNVNDVVVKTYFQLDDDKLPNVLSNFSWPPRTFSMTYKMRLEN